LGGDRAHFSNGRFPFNWAPQVPKGYFPESLLFVQVDNLRIGDNSPGAPNTRQVRLQREIHCTAIVTVLDVSPAIWIATGIALPLEEPGGTTAFTWYSPTAPGARPENRTVAAAPPIVTVGVTTVHESGLPGPGEPVAGWLLTKPKPVQ
jgi:hypothetical protein